MTIENKILKESNETKKMLSDLSEILRNERDKFIFFKNSKNEEDLMHYNKIKNTIEEGIYSLMGSVVRNEFEEQFHQLTYFWGEIDYKSAQKYIKFYNELYK